MRHAGNILLLLVKLYAFLASRSFAVLASLADSGVDLASQIVLWFCNRHAQLCQSVDRRFTPSTTPATRLRRASLLLYILRRRGSAPYHQTLRCLNYTRLPHLPSGKLRGPPECLSSELHMHTHPGGLRNWIRGIR